MHRHKVSVRSLMALMLMGTISITMSVGLSGCLLMPKQEAAEVEEVVTPPPFDIQVGGVEQHYKVGKKVLEGGQILLVRLNINNKGTAEIKTKPEDFTLRYDAKKKEERYDQKPITTMNVDITIYLGPDKADKILTAENIINPHFMVEKILAFPLPNDANLQDYKIRYVPTNYTLPLVSPETKLQDFRKDEKSFSDAR